MGFQGTLYNSLFKRSSTFALVVIVGAFVVESGIDHAAEFIFNEKNKGKLWHHIKDNYSKSE